MQRRRMIPALIRRSHAALLLTILALILGSAQAVVGAAEATATDFVAIDRYVETQMREQRIPGLALGIVKGDQIVHLQGFGIAGPAGAPMTAQTPLSIGSLTKSFTAVAIMQLAEAGRLDLDAPVQRYLPWFQVADPVATAQITLRQLLNHASGLPRTLDTAYENRPDEGADTLELRLRSLSTVALERPPGSYGYSNAGYQVLAMVIQQVSGQSYEAYVREHIFAPLGMAQSFTALSEASQHGMASGYHYWFGMPVAADLPAYRVGPGNGGLFSSAEDMSRYLLAQLNGGRFGGASILTPAGIAELQRPAVAQAPEPGFYAMGWGVQTTAGATTLTHSGQSYNYLAKMMLVPEEQWGVVVLQNAQYTVRFLSGDLNQDQIANGVLSMLRGQPLPAPYSRSGFFLVYAGFALLLLGQLLGLWRTVSVGRRWSADPERRPRGGWQKLGRVGLPAALNLGWAALTLIVLPLAVGQEVGYQIPDLSATLLASGSVALVSGSLRIVWAARGRRSATTAQAVSAAG